MKRSEARFMLVNPELLLAFAEGKEIEYALKDTNKWFSGANAEDMSFDPSGWDYRIKREPRVKYYVERNNGFVVYTSDEEAKAVSRCNDLNDPDQPDEGGVDMYRPYRLVKFVEQL